MEADKEKYKIKINMMLESGGECLVKARILRVDEDKVCVDFEKGN
jgi:hypothetical protein